MKVILTQDVKTLGKKGDVVNVAEGYGNNFLLPRGLAKEANALNMANLAQDQARQEAKKQKELETARAMGEKLKDAVVKIPAKSGEGGRLFGSVTNKEIADAISNEYQIALDKRKIELTDAVKSLGMYDVSIKIHPEVQVKIKINVIAQ